MRWASRLVAREVELAILEDERRRVMAGELRCVLLTADAGVGKTRLASEFLARNRGRCVTLSARGSRLADTASFGLWVEALERRLRDSERAEVLRLCEGAIDELADLLRSVAAARGGVPEQHPPRTRLLEAITFLVGNLARDAPVLVLLDDAQLADTSSWHALNHLARNLEERPVLIIVAGRRAELAADVLAADVLLALEQDGRLSRLTLTPLGADGVRELAAAVLGREPPRGLIDWLRGRALGNPLFVIGLLQGLLAQGDLSSPALDAIPTSLGDAIASQVRALDQRERGIVELLAVTSRAVEVRDLPGVEAATLETLARSGLVIEAERGRALALEIAHPLIQDAIYERIGALRRRELHRHVGRQLLRAGRLGDAAPHFAHSADPGDWEAIGALRAAMRQAERRASYQEAMTILDALVELLPTGDARWADVLDDMAWRAEWVVDHRADMLTEHAVTALRAIEAALGPTIDPARRAAVSYRLASFLGWGTGDLVGAERACREARRWYASTGDHAAVLLADNELAHQRGLQGDYVSMEAEAVALAEAARAAGELFARMQALAVAGFAAGFRGRVAAAEALLTVSADLALTEGKRHRRTVALTGLACALAFAGRVDEARAAVSDAESWTPSGATASCRSGGRWSRGAPATSRGRWPSPEMRSRHCRDRPASAAPSVSSSRHWPGSKPAIASLRATTSRGHEAPTRQARGTASRTAATMPTRCWAPRSTSGASRQPPVGWRRWTRAHSPGPSSSTWPSSPASRRLLRSPRAPRDTWSAWPPGSAATSLAAWPASQGRGRISLPATPLPPSRRQRRQWPRCRRPAAGRSRPGRTRRSGAPCQPKATATLRSPHSSPRRASSARAARRSVNAERSRPCARTADAGAEQRRRSSGHRR